MKKNLDGVIKKYRWRFETIRDFLTNVQQFLYQDAVRGINELDIDSGEAEELETLANAISKAAEAAKNKTKFSEISLDLSDKVTKIAMGYLANQQHQTILAEMVLIHLFSYLEALLTDYLATIYLHRPSMMAGAGKIDIELALSFKSMKKMKERLAQRESRKISYGNIDDFDKYFRDKFNLDIRTFSGWQELREAYFRRNVIVHNQGRINEQYLKAVSGKMYLDQFLLTDTGYVSQKTELVIEFVSFFHAKVLSGFKLS